VKVAFRVLPGIRADVPRPLVDVHVDGVERTGLLALADTGSLHNRFGAWVARIGGIDLSNIAPESIGVGGRPLVARTVTVGLRVGRHQWEAPVSFCEPWPWEFQILGQEGFFRWFRVVVEAADRSMTITRVPESHRPA